MGFTPYCLHRKPAAARRGHVCSPTRTSVTTAFAAPTMVAPKHHVKDEDGVPCYIYKMPKQMLVKVGSGSSADTFQLKSAEWADVKAGSHMMPPFGRRPAAVRNTRPSLQLELQHRLRHLS